MDQFLPQTIQRGPTGKRFSREGFGPPTVRFFGNLIIGFSDRFS
jgi:hypothetical protein